MFDKNLKEFLIEKGLFSLLMVLIINLCLIILFLIIEASPAFYNSGFLNFISGLKWSPDNMEFGIFPMILGSVYVTASALAIAIPLSVSCAIFLEEIAPTKVKNIFKPILQTLAGIPSVIYGFFGVMLLLPIIRNIFGGSGFSIMSASIILALMIVPTIISVSQDSIKSVPVYYREVSLAIGSTKWQSIKNIVLPIALPGILSAIILGMGRAIGETLAVLMLAGNVSMIPNSFLNPVRTLTSNIALEMGYATDIHYNSLFATAIILFIIIVILMIIMNCIQYKYTLKEGE